VLGAISGSVWTSGQEVEAAGSGVELAGQHLEGGALAGAVEAKKAEALQEVQRESQSKNAYI